MPMFEATDEKNRGASRDSRYRRWRTVLYDSRQHTLNQAERQIMKAARCGMLKARTVLLEAYLEGSAVVCSGPREHCEAVAQVLAEIGLEVRVES